MATFLEHFPLDLVLPPPLDATYVHIILASAATVTSIELAQDLPLLLVSRCPIQLYYSKKDGSEVGHRRAGTDGIAVTVGRG